MNIRFGLLAAVLVATGGSLAAAPSSQTAAHLAALSQQGVPEDAIIGVDSHGIPMICGGGQPESKTGSTPTRNALLPPGVRSWECIPNVIRNDGVEWFRLEADVNGPATSVSWGWHSSIPLISESGTGYVQLHDDGLNGDRVAGDYIFTSEKCRFDTNHPYFVMPPTENYYPDTPAGVYRNQMGDLLVDGNAFLINPSVAILDTNVPAVDTVLLSSNIQVSAHLINIVTTNRDLQRVLRGTGGALSPLTQRIYSVLPDAFDFLPFFSTDHLEYSNRLTSANFVLGKNLPVSRNFTGAGTFVFDSAPSYGSGGRLKGISMLDIMERGTGSSQNALHEISHHWAAELSTSLFITSGDGHYSPNCNINSILGGQYTTITNTGPGGGYLQQCFAYDFTNATPLDKYLMGLTSTSAVPPLLVSSNIAAIPCNGVITNLRAPVTISNIVAVHGVRTPGPATAQRDFRLGFVTASHNRLLTATEMTYYDLMAAHFTKPLPPDFPTPHVNYGWVPMTKFFGEGTTWNSDVLGLIRPTITGAEMSNNVFRVFGTGYPGKAYRLLSTTNFAQWTAVATNTAATNGSFTLQHNAQATARFYRLNVSAN
jgi:hypothetical protein